MEFKKSEDGRSLYVALIGELDATRMKEIEETIFREREDVSEVIFDLERLEYISSAGIRFLLKMQQDMKKKGTMVLKNLNGDVLDILKVTGIIKHLNVI